MKNRQNGNTVIGLIIGLVIGLGVALGIAVYVTKVPVPFMAKTQRGGAVSDEAEARKNQNWDPNAPLAGKPRAPATAPPAAEAVTAAVPAETPTSVARAPAVAPSEAAPAPVRPPPVPVETTAKPSSTDPIGDFAKAHSGSGASAVAAPAAGTDPFVYFVQVGAFRAEEDADAQRAKLSLMGVEARVTERELAGRTVYRVRAGPYNKKDDADQLKGRLDTGGLESTLVRVQR